MRGKKIKQDLKVKILNSNINKAIKFLFWKMLEFNSI